MTMITAGNSIIVRIRTGTATQRTTVSACCLQRRLGTISPKINTIIVMIIVESVEASASPPFTFAKSAMAIDVDAVEAAILARLLPIRMAERAVVKLSLILHASRAVREPDSLALRKRILFEALKDISLPEKNAESTSITKIIIP